MPRPLATTLHPPTRCRLTRHPPMERTYMRRTLSTGSLLIALTGVAWGLPACGGSTSADAHIFVGDHSPSPLDAPVVVDAPSPVGDHTPPFFPDAAPVDAPPS